MISFKYMPKVKQHTREKRHHLGLETGVLAEITFHAGAFKIYEFEKTKTREFSAEFKLCVRIVLKSSKSTIIYKIPK